jgi:hypothetical protein
MARYDSAEKLVAAARGARAAGFREPEAYSPFPVEGLHEVLRLRDRRLPAAVFLGGLGGGIFGYLMQFYISVKAYPLNVGGKPLNSWPAFIPVTFELTVLGAALAAVLCVIVLNGLPKPYHPVFHHPSFERATLDRFFLCLRCGEKSESETRRFFEQTGAEEIYEVPE